MSQDIPIIPPDAPQAANLNQVYTLAKGLRGAFIDQAIWIDVVITDILARYFVPDHDKRMLFTFLPCIASSHCLYTSFDRWVT